MITVTSQTSSSSSSSSSSGSGFGSGNAQSSFGVGGTQISGGVQSNFGGAQFGAQSGFDGAINVSAGGAGSVSGIGSALSGATGNEIILNGNNQA